MVSSSSLASSRQVLAWSLPTVAIVLSILWFRKRQRRHQTDPGGTPEDATISSTLEQQAQVPVQQLVEELQRQHFVQQLQQQLKPREVSSIPEEEEEELDDPEEVKIVLEEVEKLMSESAAGVLVVDEPEEVQQQPSPPPEHEDEEIILDKAAEAPIEAVSEEEEEAMASAACAATAEEPVPAPVEPKQTEPEASEDAADAQPKKGKKTKGKKQPKQDQVEQICQVMSKITVDVQPAQAQPRDSANHSPSEAMLASPSISHDSDSHSVNSNDSGKGGSDVTTNILEEDAEKGGKTRTRTSSRRASSCSIAGSEHNLDEVQSGGASSADRDDGQLQGQLVASAAACCVYDFYIPIALVGRLIGKHGCFVNQIKSETHSQIQVKKHFDVKYKIVSLTGSQVEIEKALSLIRKKFPKKKYPGFTMDQIGPEDLIQPAIPMTLRMYLVESINNDVILSSLVSAGHMFVQQPTHPTFPFLSQLIILMTEWYSKTEAPTLTYPKPTTICAAPSLGSWYRAEVVDVRTELSEENQEETVCDIKFVDYGGYTTLPLSELRQIRHDFVLLPLQATECYLADVIWPDGDDGWSEAAFNRVEDLTRNQVLQAQVVGYAENSVPYIRLYSSHTKSYSVNEVLAQENYAKLCIPY
ncbi:A-kinase anchor protein 1, mitochondrial isoform X2 [Cloeon dipterum]